MDLHIPIWLAKGVLAVILAAFFCWLCGRLNEKHKGVAYVIAGLHLYALLEPRAVAGLDLSPEARRERSQARIRQRMNELIDEYDVESESEA